MFTLFTPHQSQSNRVSVSLIVPHSIPARRILAVGSALSLGLTSPSFTSASYGQTPLNPELKVGIVQRFGEKATDKLTIQAMPGDQLTLSFKSKGQVETLTAPKVEFDIQMQPLAEPKTTSKVVISTHRSFESAEANANNLKAQGFQVELAQPDKWQVWGLRDLYVKPENQLWLKNQVQARGFPNAFIDQKKISQKPQLSWSSNGYRYHRDTVSIESGTQQFKVNQDRFVGRLYFQPNAYGTYTLVNETPIESYLRGVVPYEIGPKAPPAAVQAQAIIARTYALRNLRRFKVDNYELCATTQCQIYRGLDASTPSVDEAIAATTGRVLTYNNELVDALYSSQTGGVTAQFEDIWEGSPRPYLQSKIDAVPNEVWDLTQNSLADETNFRKFISLKSGFNEEGWDYFRWQKDSPIKQVNEELRSFLKAENHPLANFKSVQNIVVSQRSRGGRVQKLTVMTDLGNVELSKDEILRALDAPNSLLFYVQPKSKAETTAPPASNEAEPSPAASSTVSATKQVLEGFTFTGGGLGHAVGLSQAGSYHLSDLGYSAEKILAFYFPGTTLQPLTESIVYWKDKSSTPVVQQPTSNSSESKQTPALAQSSEQKPAQESESSLAQSSEQESGPEILGIKLPKIRFNVLWEWIPFF